MYGSEFLGGAGFGARAQQITKLKVVEIIFPGGFNAVKLLLRRAYDLIIEAVNLIQLLVVCTLKAVQLPGVTVVNDGRLIT